MMLLSLIVFFSHKSIKTTVLPKGKKFQMLKVEIGFLCISKGEYL